MSRCEWKIFAATQFAGWWWIGLIAVVVGFVCRPVFGDVSKTGGDGGIATDADIVAAIQALQTSEQGMLSSNGNATGSYLLELQHELNFNWGSGSSLYQSLVGVQTYLVDLKGYTDGLEGLLGTSNTSTAGIKTNTDTMVTKLTAILAAIDALPGGGGGSGDLSETNEILSNIYQFIASWDETMQLIPSYFTDISNKLNALTSMNTKLTTISNNTTTMVATLGTMSATLSTLNGKVADFYGEFVTRMTAIKTVLDNQYTSTQTIASNTSSMKTTLEHLSGKVDDYLPYLGTIKTTLDDIYGFLQDQAHNPGIPAHDVPSSPAITVPLIPSGGVSITDGLREVHLSGEFDPHFPTFKQQGTAPSGSGSREAGAPVWHFNLPLRDWFGGWSAHGLPNQDIIIDWEFWSPFRALAWSVMLFFVSINCVTMVWEEVRKYG